MGFTYLIGRIWRKIKGKQSIERKKSKQQHWRCFDKYLFIQSESNLPNPLICSNNTMHKYIRYGKIKWNAPILCAFLFENHQLISVYYRWISLFAIRQPFFQSLFSIFVFSDFQRFSSRRFILNWIGLCTFNAQVKGQNVIEYHRFDIGVIIKK